MLKIQFLFKTQRVYFQKYCKQNTVRAAQLFRREKVLDAVVISTVLHLIFWTRPLISRVFCSVRKSTE